MEPDARDDLQLMDRHNEIGTFAVFAILTKSNWGIGMMAMPYYMHCAGLWAGVAFFVLTMALSADAAMCLVRCQKQVLGCAKLRTYSELMRALLGVPGEVAVHFSIVVANVGSCIAWLKFIGDNLERFVPVSHMTADAWTSLATLAVAPCIFVDRVASLDRISFVGLLAGQAFILLLVTRATGHWSHLPLYAQDQPVIRLTSFPIAMGLAVFCNEGMILMTPSLHESMQTPCRFPWALAAMVVYFTSNYLVVAVLGDFIFSYEANGVVESELALSFEVTAIYRATTCCYIAQLLLSFPTLTYAIFSGIEAALFMRSECQCMPLTPARRIFRAAIILFAGAIAMAVPRFGDFLGLLGGLCNSVGIYILPHSAMLRSASRGHLKIGVVRQVASWAIVIVFGVAAGVAATVVSFFQFVQ